MTMRANRTLGEASQWIVDELRRRGIQVNPSCRLGRYATQFGKNAYAGPWGPEDQARKLEALMAWRDVEEIAMILDQLPSLSKKDLERLVDDAPIPRLDHATPGRDRQVELFVGAICRRGRMEVQLDREPDLWCEVSRVWLGVAVKRVRSANKFEANLKDAADQIERSQLACGVVCMEFSLAWNPDLAIVQTNREAPVVAFDYRERLSRLLDDEAVATASVFHRFPKTLGVLCIDHSFTEHRASGPFRDQCSLFAWSFRNDRCRTRTAKGFQEGWTRGLPNCVNMDNQPRTWAFAGPPDDKIVPLRPGA